jgi:formamidopyrimidine-DNA glycosylase
MTGRMYLARRDAPLPKHAAVVLELGRENFVFEDTRYFGRLTLDGDSMARLGPEPLGEEFTVSYLSEALARSTQAIKVRLLDQTLVAGIGNIYASEALFRAGITPDLPSRNLTVAQVRALRRAIREVLREAIRFGSTVPLHHGRGMDGDGLFYFGRAADAPDFYEERLRVYDRAGKPCKRCEKPIRRIVQAARSTFYCPRCQSNRRATWAPTGAWVEP